MRLRDLRKIARGEILLEARIDRYLQMFARVSAFAKQFDAIVPNSTGKKVQAVWDEKVRESLKWAMRVLRKEDKIVWYAMHVRYSAAIHLIDYVDLMYDKKTISDDLYNKIRQIGSALIDQVEKYREGILAAGDDSSWSNNVNSQNFQNFMEHIMLQEIPGVDEYVFTGKSYSRISQDLRRIEEAYNSRQRQTIPKEEAERDATIVLQFPDGSAWWNLNRSYCQREGNALGHCGNVVGRTNTNQRLLSFRRPVEVKGQMHWRPSLTFVLEPDGHLGEMKGRENTKPKAEYHPYIVELLKLPLIKGIEGGGYKPEANFSLMDLPQETREELVTLKPELMDDITRARMVIEKVSPLPPLVDLADQENPTVIVMRGLEKCGLTVDRFDHEAQKFIFEEHTRIEFLMDNARGRDASRLVNIMQNGPDFDIDVPDYDDVDYYLPRGVRQKIYDKIIAEVIAMDRDSVLEELESENVIDEDQRADAPHPLTPEWLNENTEPSTDLWKIVSNEDGIAMEIRDCFRYAMESSIMSQAQKLIDDWFRDAVDDLPNGVGITFFTERGEEMVGVTITMDHVRDILEEQDGGDLVYNLDNLKFPYLDYRDRGFDTDVNDRDMLRMLNDHGVI